MTSQRGFTLLELLMILIVVSILSSIAIVSIPDSIRSSHASAAASNIFHAIQNARNQSRLNRRPYSLCGSDDGSICSREWVKQLILFEDSNNNQQPEAAEIIYHYPVDARRFKVQTRVGFGKIIANFTRDGYTRLTGSFLICDAQASNLPIRKVTWNLIGRPYILNSTETIKKHSSIKCL